MFSADQAVKAKRAARVEALAEKIFVAGTARRGDFNSYPEACFAAAEEFVATAEKQARAKCGL